ncbi:hypothetical protein FUAX_47170 (plasmid) [Fulvitalea axinellae]|uniref:DUF4988 domain-containing protein n=1 Tax=Fulvitalea axinellae TaxID=1182444 RepID=A0AAU9DI89_9BACT|nr:hypothetical protein FUAX_47170 [Fulvitalea axinellae]
MKNIIILICFFVVVSACDVDSLDDRLSTLEDRVQVLEEQDKAFIKLIEAQNSNLRILEVLNSDDGTILNMSNGTEIKIPGLPSIGENGNWWIGGEDTGVKAQVRDGEDGESPEVGENGNWWIGGEDTGVKAQARDGEDGESPEIGKNGNWWIGGEDTGVKAQARDGEDGESPEVGENGNWWIGGEDTGVKAQARDGEDGESPEVGENGNWWIGGEDTGVKAVIPIITEIKFVGDTARFTFSDGTYIELKVQLEGPFIQDGLYVAKVDFFDFISSDKESFFEIQKEEILVWNGVPKLRRYKESKKYQDVVIYDCGELYVDILRDSYVFSGLPEAYIGNQKLDKDDLIFYESHNDQNPFFNHIVNVNIQGILVGYQFFPDKSEFSFKIPEDIVSPLNRPKVGFYTDSGLEIYVGEKSFEMRSASGRVKIDNVQDEKWTNGFSPDGEAWIQYDKVTQKLSVHGYELTFQPGMDDFTIAVTDGPVVVSDSPKVGFYTGLGFELYVGVDGCEMRGPDVEAKLAVSNEDWVNGFFPYGEVKLQYDRVNGVLTLGGDKLTFQPDMVEFSI